MADNVQWIKFKVGMFDGESFKRIKRAKIGGVTYRDKLTAVWFELMDLAGKSNRDGYLIDAKDLPYRTYEDIAIMLDREEKEVELCMQFFLAENMVEVIDDIYCLTNWLKYQSLEGLEKIREQKRIKQAKWREKKKEQLSDVGSTEGLQGGLQDGLPSYSYSISNSNNKKEIGGMGGKENKKEKLKGLVEASALSENIKNELSVWLEYKKYKYEELGFKSLLTIVGKKVAEFGEQAVIDVINESISNTWKGIIWDKLEKRKSAKKSDSIFEPGTRLIYKE